MDADELKQLLNAGIAATQRGDKAQGRELLLRVVEADERIEPAWLWLAAALEDPADQLLALENVLTLNPRHPQALAGAAALRAQLGVSAPPPAAPEADETPSPVTPAEAAWLPSEPRTAVAPVVVPPQPTADMVDGTTFEDDPYQCAYCGRPTLPEDERCPFCGRNLLMPGFWKGGSYQYWLLILVGLQVQAGMLQVAGTVLQGSFPEALNIVPGAGALLVTPVAPAVARLIAYGLALLVLLQDHRRAYHATLLVALADGAWMAWAYTTGQISAPLAVVNASLGALIGLLAATALISQAQARQRRRVVLGRGLVSAPQMHEQAETYAQQGLWALAALHWRRAIGKDPRNLAYYKGLGRAQVALKQYAQAIRTFRSGVELAPDDKEFQRLIESVRAHTRSS